VSVKEPANENKQESKKTHKMATEKGGCSKGEEKKHKTKNEKPNSATQFQGRESVPRGGGGREMAVKGHEKKRIKKRQTTKRPQFQTRLAERKKTRQVCENQKHKRNTGAGV